MAMKKLTPVLMVEAIEPVLPFWERLGFDKRMEVPHEGRLGFVGLERDGVEIMYQTVDSVRSDIPPLARKAAAASFLFIEVQDLDAIESALAGVDPVVPRRTTFLRRGRADRAGPRGQRGDLRRVREHVSGGGADG